MGKMRGGPHLLEAFRSSAMGGAERLPSAPTQRPSPRPTTPEAPPREVTLGEHACLVLRLSAGVLAALVLVVLALGVVLFAVGRLSVRLKPAELLEEPKTALPLAPSPAPGDRRAALPPAVPPSGEVGGPAPEVGAVPPVYSIRVSTYGAGKGNLAEEFATFLRSQGFPDVEVRLLDKEYRVYVGRFPRQDDPVAQRLLEQVKRLHYSSSDLSSARVTTLPQ